MIGFVVLLGDIGVGHHDVLRQTLRLGGDAVHQGLTDPAALLGNGGRGVELDGLAEIDLVKPGR